MKDNKLEINKLYILESTITNKPYLGEENTAFVFLTEGDAKKVAAEIADTDIGEPKFWKLDDLYAMCWEAGAEKITIQIGEQKDVLPMNAPVNPLMPSGHDLNQAVSLTKQTKQKKYIYKLKICEFIIPAKVKTDNEVEITYGIAQHVVPEIGKLYIAFSSIGEFALWKSEVPEWEPLKVSFSELKRICGKYGIMLNPLGNRLIVTHENIKEISERKVSGGSKA